MRKSGGSQRRPARAPKAVARMKKPARRQKPAGSKPAAKKPPVPLRPPETGVPAYYADAAAATKPKLNGVDPDAPPPANDAD